MHKGPQKVKLAQHVTCCRNSADSCLKAQKGLPVYYKKWCIQISVSYIMYFKDFGQLLNVFLCQKYCAKLWIHNSTTSNL